MKNQSKKALLLLSGLLLAATSAKAEGQYDGSSFWYGFIVGGGSTLCQLAEGGVISNNDAANFMKGMMDTGKTDPDLTDYKQDFLNAYQELKDIQGCNGIFK